MKTLAKLSFEKSVVAVLNKAQQSELHGGTSGGTHGSVCISYYQTCESVPYTQFQML
ncbi:class I lanthipeptide [Chitinophaga skermanii]|uniref:class I lanthipeptide n=1 Tax=Chitinophaga skermanii TaxID=331697 RepID=UPI0037449F4F